MTTNSAQVLPFIGNKQIADDKDSIATSPFPEDSPLFFPVEERSISVADEHGLPTRHDGYKAVVRTDTDEVLGVHGSSYKVVPNEPLYRGFDDALQQSGLDLEGLKITDHVNYGGRRTIRNYRFPTTTVEPRVNDIVEMKISVINSFDSFNAFTAQVSGMRLWCLNGAVTAHGSTSVYGRHTRGFDTSRAVAKVAEAIERYMLTTMDWSEWTERELTELQAKTALESFPDLNPTLLQRLEEAWSIESDEAGRTVWALYNAVTRWSTHTPVRTNSEPNRESIVLDRERRVRQFMRGSAFKRLAA